MSKSCICSASVVVLESPIAKLAAMTETKRSSASVDFKQFTRDALIGETKFFTTITGVAKFAYRSMSLT
jgi:hypothetical protein